jgi:hypothetical protein
MALRDDVLPVFYGARQLIEDLGLRTHRLLIRTYVWSGGKVNAGTRSVQSEVEIAPRPKIRETQTGYTVEKITPEFSGGGYTLADFDALHVDGVQAVFVVVDPDGNERLCIYEPDEPGADSLNTQRNFGYSLKLRHLDRRTPR